ncbi:hypothetical protein CN931_07035 [Bacillus sp. AFS054943]|uniref:HD-GYP domain-containing protein n=1 Tax=unclassified Bacillus (in: firmicutes) TaxID=185979 RepID=UPI000BFD3A9D|nr:MULTISPECIES: HD-GYP domain-containing protein [unclassified Bacillus (in: firmicutes)]PGL86236.1 hypothetical protein CN931_07035 [Bacillus sp. AFS054943]PGX01260.1 hypothetical protein COE07_26805 [Bacillus sp. AFS033286]
MKSTKLTTKDFLASLTRLLGKSKRTPEGTMQSILNILELKDSYTKGHSERVAKYTLILAKKTNKYSEEDLIKFYFSCLLHDIGKIGISNEILNKTSCLTNDEYKVMKTHPTVGINLIENYSLIEGYEAVIRSHHEKWDGSGYPDGLKNNDIPLCARIISIADAFDAMTSTRPYRVTLSPEEAYKQIIEGAGNQFDPELVEDFKIVYSSWVEILEDSSD